MRKSLWLLLALAALGLWASLVPQVTYPSVSSGKLSNDALIVWPGWGVQQDLGPVSGAVGRFQIWASAQPHGPEVSLHATLVDASTREVIRDKSIVITPAHIPIKRTVTFPSYTVPDRQRLLLQLQVADFEEHYVTYQLAVPQEELANIEVNGVPDAGAGPLAFVHLETSSGLRAAIQGEQSGRERIAVAIALSGFAVLAHPQSVARLWRASIGVRRVLARRRASETDAPRTFGRILATPWYPWPAVVIPILHFLANNDIRFSVREAFTPLAVGLLLVSGTIIGLRFLLKDWHRPAAAMTVVTVMFFLYGHVERALDGPIDEQLFFGAAVVLCTAAVTEAVRVGGFLSRGTQFFNVVAAALLVMQVVQVAGGAAFSLGSPASRVAAGDLTANLFPSGIPTASYDRPDIYYIILDAYGRNDALVDLDNSAFLRDLEARGFHIATEATSNYVSTPHSLASSLNMSYLHELGTRTPASHSDLMNLAYYNSLAAILKSLGYTYVHLDSGH